MLTEPNYAGEFILSEARDARSREEVVIGASQTLLAGRVLGQIGVGTLSIAAVASGSGNGAITGSTVAPGSKRGAYIAVALSATEFLFQDPQGIELGTFPAGSPFALGGITATVAIGGVPWAVGDAVTYTVSAALNPAAAQYVALNPAATDGSQTAAGIAFSAVTTGAGSTVKTMIVVRDVTVRSTYLDWGALSAPQIAAAMAQLSAVNRILFR
jgi:hypothetical protein